MPGAIMAQPVLIMRFIFTLMACLCLAPVVQASGIQSTAERWTQFARSLERLHTQRLDGFDIKTEESVGGYGGVRGDPEFYTQTSYIDHSTGRLLARVQRENRKPALLHTIELYIHDDQGRLAREYIAAYLPGRRELPFQTLIIIYSYVDGLQAFREFDASDDLLFEFCEGELEGRKVRIAWDYLEIPDKADEIMDQYMRTAYKKCFTGLPRTAGSYLEPLNELK